MRRMLMVVCMLVVVAGLGAAVNVPDLLLDSVVIKAGSDNWNTKKVYEVDDNGHMKSTTMHQWDNTLSRWLKVDKYEYTADEQGYVLKMAYYNWSYEDNKWYGVRKSDYTYNSTYEETGELICGWNSETKRWKNSQNIERTYNEDGRLIQQITLVWGIYNRWVNSEKIAVTYNNSNQRTSNAHYTWSSKKNQWVLSTLQKSKYNEQGRVLETTNQLFSGSENQALVNQKTVYTYDDTTCPYIETTYDWNTLSNQWVPERRSEQQYNTNGFPTVYRYFRWDVQGNKWVINQQETTNYTKDGRLISFQSCTYVNDSVVGSGVKSENEYDENGRCTRFQVTRWNNLTKTWDYESDNQYSYDAFGNKTTEQRYNWNEYENKRKGQKKIETTYDLGHRVNDVCAFSSEVNLSSSGQLPVTYKEYRWNTATGNWQPTPESVKQYHYSPFSGIEQPDKGDKLEVYLDPVSDDLYVNDPFIGENSTGPVPSVKVFDINGNLLMTTPSRTLHLSPFADGIYLVTYNGKSAKVIKR